MVKKHDVVVFINKFRLAIVVSFLYSSNIKALLHVVDFFSSSHNSTSHRVPYLIAILISVSEISHYMRFLFLMLCQSLFSQSSTAICDLGPSARGKPSKCLCLYFYVKLQTLL